MSEPQGSVQARVELRTIDDVIARMNEIGREVMPPDGVAYFNDLYLRVTEAVHAGVTGTAGNGAVTAPAPRDRITGPKVPAEPLGFKNKEFIDKLDVAFSEYYFKAYETQGVDAASWSPLFKFRRHKRAPLQFAVCGMNAHINHDLPMAIVETAERLGIEPRGDSDEHEDFTKVNDLLATVEMQVKREFVRGALAEIDNALDDEPEKLAMWSIAEARELAWRHAELLWKLRKRTELCNIYHGLLADFANLAGHGILI